MRIFRCDACGHALYFENARCLHCASALAFLPDRMDLCAVEPEDDDAQGRWRRKTAAGGAPQEASRWRLCQHRDDAAACNFAIPAQDANPLCASCRLTRVLPDLSVAGNPQRWGRIETAKRRLWFTLVRLGLEPAAPADGQPHGPLFELKANLPGQPVTTGHADGVITLDVAEADEDERARRRIHLHEPYRTLLGHLRHESGHYYWQRLVAPGEHLAPFRQAFGDERADYTQALQAHYAGGAPPAHWQPQFVSAYASAHPWEDWAETWAHYLHMVDLLETAASYNTRVEVPGEPAAHAPRVQDPFEKDLADFETLVAQWVPVTLLVNSLNRSLGQEDAYPFALGAGALDKLRFVHHLVGAQRGGGPGAANLSPTSP